MILDINSEVIVITNNNEIIASGYATIKQARHYLDHEVYSYLGFMYTRPDHRGKGVNKMVIDALRSGLKTKELLKFVLRSMKRTAEQYRLMKSGVRKTHYRDAVEMNNKSIESRTFEKNTAMHFEEYLDLCPKMDADDPLHKYRSEFHFPKVNGKPVIYFTGNSLGLQPKRTQKYIDEVMTDWAGTRC